MSVRVRYAVAASVSSTSAEEKDLGNVKFEVVTDAETKGGSWKTVLLASAADVQLHLDTITTVQLLVIRTNAVDPNESPVGITIKRNSTGGETILIKPVGDAKEGIMILSTDGLTSLYASNPGSVDMNLTITAVGV